MSFYLHLFTVWYCSSFTTTCDFLDLDWKTCSLPTKHWTLDRNADHVCIWSVGPWPILDIYLTSKLGPLFGLQTMTQLGRRIDVQHFTFELGTFFGRNLDVFDRCRKCIHDPTAQLIFDIFFILLDYVMFQGVFCTIVFESRLVQKKCGRGSLHVCMMC